MTELMIPLDNDSERPLYQQIYEYIREEIADGKISCGEKLPSTRLLAKHLLLSRSTVELAYEQLLAEGYVEAQPCRGYFASDISKLYLESRQGQKMRRDLTREEKKETYQVVFSPDRNEMGYFPYGAWRKISRELLSGDDPELFLSGEAAGERELREAICKYLYHARGVNASTEQIVVGAGNEYLLILLSQVLGEKKRVAMENPTYLKAYHTFSNMRYEICAIGMDQGGILMEEVEKASPDIVYTMPSHQFPMGTLMPMKRRLELLNWAAGGEERYIIEDDHDSEFRYKGKPIPSLQGNDRDGSVIYIGTFSKSISPSVRVSYMVLPEKLLERYNENCGFYASTVPKEQQLKLAAFFDQGHFERYLNRMRGVYKGKHDYFLGLLKRETWVHKIYGDNAGMHLLVEVDSDLSQEDIVRMAKERGVLVYTLEEYQIPGSALKEKKYPTLLLGYGGLSEREMQCGIEILRGIVR
ncbi:MAG: PLP-dependent aminotransferase family protein [Roseburia sp.]|nr:PLP-dependent aminotransferase family protein [Roseburia sp.]